MDRDKIKKIYSYLSSLAKTHNSTNSKYNGYSLYDNYNKKKGFSVQEYNWEGNEYIKFYLVDVDFNYSRWYSDRSHERIKITIHIDKGMNDLNIKEVMVKDGADIAYFFRKLDNCLEDYISDENKLLEILNKKGNLKDE